jgi:hypothetical protein
MRALEELSSGFIVDNNYCRSYFVKSEDHLKTKVVELVKDLKDKGRFVKYVRPDDSGENASIKRACKEKCLDVKFEFSSPNDTTEERKSQKKVSDII